MKKLSAIIITAIIAAACNPFGFNIKYEDFDLEGQFWAVSGMQAPYGQQEIGRMHYVNENDELIPAEFYFSGGKARVVFPTGAYRTVGYSMDTKARTITFDAPITYGCEVNYNGNKYVGEDIVKGKYDMMTMTVTAPGMKVEGKGLLFSFYDPSASTFTAVDIEKQQWSISMVNMVELSLEPLYEISGEYGTKSQGSNLGAEDAAKWSSECVYNDALFPWVEGLDLCQIHWGPAWRTPTEAEAQWLLDNCTVLKAKQKGTDNYYMYFMYEATGRSISFPVGDINEEMGFWLSNGKALVYKATDPHYDTATEARIITPEPGAKYFLRPIDTRK